MNNILDYANGCKPNTPDKRDLKYEDIVLGAPNIDFNAGFDVRWILGGDIDYIDQMQSLSCVGCATAYQIYVYEMKELIRKYSQGSTPKTLAWLRQNKPQEVNKVSFKSIYSQIAYSSGGSDFRRAGDLVTKWGALYDSIVPSMKPDGTTDENWVRNKSWKTDAMDKLAIRLMGKEYRFITTRTIEAFAQAIKENLGVVGGVTGINNGTWLTERPQPPTKYQYENEAYKLWGHAMWFGAYGHDSYGDYVASPNSWDSSFSWRRRDWTPDKPAGYGWQKFYVNYFTAIQIGDSFAFPMFNPMTFVDKSNLHAEHCNVDDRYFKNINLKEENKQRAVLKKLLKREPTQREINAIIYGKWQIEDLSRTDEFLFGTYTAAVNSGIYER